MMKMALNMLAEEGPAPEIGEIGKEETRTLVNEWAEELAGISYRRNTMERALRALVINFLRMSALSSKDGMTAKTGLISALQDKRKAELEPFNLETIGEKLYWLELVAIINKHWQLFERIFGDKTAFNDNARIINDRPDAHAKHLEPSDVAMHRRALQWLDDRISRV